MRTLTGIQRLIGDDAIAVSNHDGHQLDAVPTSISVLHVIREAVGPDACLPDVGGVCSALDEMWLIGLGLTSSCRDAPSSMPSPRGPFGWRSHAVDPQDRTAPEHDRSRLPPFIDA